MEALPAFYADATANLRRGLSSGWVQPRPVVESGLAVLRAEAQLTPETDQLLKPLATLPATIPPAEQARLRERARRILADRIVPARREFLRFIETEYAPKAAAEVGVSRWPNGRPFYAYRARYHTTTPLTPDQIHALGQSEVKRIRTAMDGVMKETGFRGSFPQFLAFLRSDPQFYAQTREDLLEKASEIAKRADYQMPKLFGTLRASPTA
jgi:uncharacterized protein (DUF885 family)